MTRREISTSRPYQQVVVTNNYIAGGKDGYLTFNNVSSSLVVGTA